MRLTAWEMESRTDDPHRLTVDKGLEQSLNWWRVIRFPQPPLQVVPISSQRTHQGGSPQACVWPAPQPPPS